MHQLGIIHGDIKLENIMWSPKLNKNVYVDFGLSKIIGEKPGFKTLTKYFGTYSYCCKDMRTLF